MNIARLGSFDAQVRFTVDNKFRRVREPVAPPLQLWLYWCRRRCAEVMEDLGFWEKDNPPAVAKASVSWDAGDPGTGRCKCDVLQVLQGSTVEV